jgi:drug/metabolite transporter (DMT)-like permease
MNSKYRWAIFFAILAALLYAISMPLSKILLRNVPPMMMAAFLYIGAGVSMTLFGLIRSHIKLPDREEKIEKKIAISKRCNLAARASCFRYTQCCLMMSQKDFSSID